MSPDRTVCAAWGSSLPPRFPQTGRPHHFVAAATQPADFRSIV